MLFTIRRRSQISLFLARVGRTCTSIVVSTSRRMFICLFQMQRAYITQHCSLERGTLNGAVRKGSTWGKVRSFGIMNTASKLGPHTQTDRGTCPGVGL